MNKTVSVTNHFKTIKEKTFREATLPNERKRKATGHQERRETAYKRNNLEKKIDYQHLKKNLVHRRRIPIVSAAQKCGHYSSRRSLNRKLALPVKAQRA